MHRTNWTFNHVIPANSQGLDLLFSTCKVPISQYFVWPFKAGVKIFPACLGTAAFWQWPPTFQSDSCPRLICFILGTDEPGCKCTGGIKQIILTAEFLLAPLLPRPGPSVPCNSHTGFTESLSGASSLLTSSAKLTLLQWVYYWKGATLNHRNVLG